MPKIRSVLLTACALALAATCTVSAADEVTRSKDFSLSNVEPKDALVILRTIVGARNVGVVEPSTVTVRDTPDNLALAEAIVKLADAPEETHQETSHTASDGSVIVSVVLQHAFAIDVMTALREELAIRRIATLGERRIFLRDTEAQAKAALKMIQRMEGSGD